MLRKVLAATAVVMTPTWAVASVQRPTPSTLLEFTPAPYQIRVLLSEATGTHEVRGYDLRWNLPLKADRSTRWDVRCTPWAVTVREAGTATWRQTRGAVTVSSPAGFVFLDGHPVREELRVGPGPHGCRVSNRLDLEKYLEGLVNAEFSSKWSPEAVASQIVAARSYALYEILAAKRSGRDFDVRSTILDQVYGGARAEDAAAARAVRRTRGWVLVERHHPRQPIKAFYHSSCGGTTELPERVWGGPYAGYGRHRVSCPYCAGAPKAHWQFALSELQLIEAVRRGSISDGREPGWPADWYRRAASYRLERIWTEAWKGSPRVREVHFSWAHPGGLAQGRMDLALPATRLRHWLGQDRLLSTLFQVARGRDGRWGFEGRGNGHGVGLCQYGAKRMGELGMNHRKILAHYYPDATLAKMW
ncbi:MAG TPA: SpoIID/LytB domain-containing protein [Bdellovibrionota bacterium]|nr:SpoIID/LytB domain-containing protein [Bdellovibrionota bacterium]